jgi:hypothetical protein
VDDAFVPKKEVVLKTLDNLQLLVEKFVVHNMSAPMKREVRECSSHVIHGPMEHS